MGGVYIPHFDQISVNISVLGGPTYPYRCTAGVKFGMEEGTHAKFHPISVQRVAPGGEKPQNRPLSNLNTGCR